MTNFGSFSGGEGKLLRHADLILNNAEVIPCGLLRPFRGAIAVRGDRIMALGSDKDIADFRGPTTRIVDCQGKTLMPGFIDAHCHFFSFVRKLISLDLSPSMVGSIENIKHLIRLRAQSIPAGSWIKGTDYNEFYLEEKRHPTRRDLDQAAPLHPVILYHRSLHACVMNSLALNLAGITGETDEPSGGIIERDLDTGEPNGLLYELGDFVQSRISSTLSQIEIDNGIDLANQYYLSMGITSIGEASLNNNLGQWHTYRDLKRKGRLLSRIYMMISPQSISEFAGSGLTSRSGDNHLRVGSVKILIGEATGELKPSQGELNQIVAEINSAGFQVALHAIERSAVEAAISALEYSREQTIDRETSIDSYLKGRDGRSEAAATAQRRHRIEHCSECPQEFRERINRVHALIVSQPSFVYYSGERYLSQIPEKTLQDLYPFKSLLKSRVLVSASSDSPVAPGNPLVGMYAAVTRRAESGQKVMASEAVTIKQAINMYTINAAYASFEENEKGSLTPGKLADIVLLNANPLTTFSGRLKEIRVEMTVIGGKIVWQI